MQDSDTFDPQNTSDGNSQAVAPYTSNVVDISKDPHDQRPAPLDPIGQVGSAAYAKGAKHGNSDRERQALLGQEELADEAMSLSAEYVNSPENKAAEYDSSLVMRTYEQRYTAGYLHGARVNRSEDLPPDWKRVIQREAQRDKEADERRGNALFGNDLLSQAIDRSLDAIGIHVPETKQTVKEHMSVYLQTYEKYVPLERYEKERGSFRPARSCV